MLSVCWFLLPLLQTDVPAIVITLLKSSGSQTAMVAEAVAVLQRLYNRQQALVNTLKETFLLEGPDDVEVRDHCCSAISHLRMFLCCTLVCG